MPWVVAVNVMAFAVMAWDKHAARYGRSSHRRRVPERALWTLAVLGGTPGMIIAMWALRHKNRKRVFAYGLPLLVLAQGWATGALLGWWQCSAGAMLL